MQRPHAAVGESEAQLLDTERIGGVQPWRGASGCHEARTRLQVAGCRLAGEARERIGEDEDACEGDSRGVAQLGCGWS